MNTAIDRRTFLTLAGAALLNGAGVGCSSGTTPLDAAGFTAARRFAKTALGDIAYVERGSGRAALFLHGFPLNGFQWRGAVERLAPLRRCIAPDFLGLGHTRVAATQSVAPQAQMDMLVALLDALSVDSVDIVANDSGGAIAQLLATRHAARVRTLLLTNCDTEHDSPPPALQPVIELSKQGKFVDEWLAPWHANPTLARSAQGIGGMCYTDPAHPTDAALEMYFAPLLSSTHSRERVHAYAAALERNPLAGIGAALQRSQIPTRVLWGTADTIFATSAPEQLMRSLGNSRGLRRLEGRKLFWPEELPEVVAEEARQLWS
jgi:pimeloyl-ACP methyl ester carboxylesterase